MTHQELRTAVVDAARAMEPRGLTRGTSGNVSVRVPEGMLVTPSAVPYHAVAPADLVLLDLEGAVLESTGHRPSTEWRVHARILATRPDVGSVLHAHPLYCTTLACHGLHIPAFHYMVAVAGGDSIRCAPYATFGSPELADLALTALEDRLACLLANHGMLAVGPSPAEALALAVEVEALAAQYWHALQLGEPVLLDAAEMDRVMEAFRRYRA